MSGANEGGKAIVSPFHGSLSLVTVGDLSGAVSGLLGAGLGVVVAGPEAQAARREETTISMDPKVMLNSIGAG